MPRQELRLDCRSTALAIREPSELQMLQDAVGELEVLCWEAFTFDTTLTKDAARRMILIADIFGWEMQWLEEMREWSR